MHVDSKTSRENSRNNEFSSRLIMTMDPFFGSELQDVIRDSKFSFIVSKRLKEFLDNENLINNGFIPAVIANDKNKIIAKNYFLVHQTIHQNCIDMEKSIVSRNAKKIVGVTQLIINELHIDSKLQLFRPKYYPNLLIVKRQLATKIKRLKFTGIGFDEIENYNQFLTL
jgi:hypothetical protein